MSAHTVGRALPVGPIVAAVGVGLLVGYTAAVDPVVRSPSQVAYPVVWLLVSAAALERYVVPALASSSLPAVAVGGGYALALQYAAGLLGPGSPAASTSLHLALPGWGPALVGLFACVSCTAPLIAGVTGSLGPGTLATTVSHAQYPLATGAFLLSVGGFAWLLPAAER